MGSNPLDSAQKLVSYFEQLVEAEGSAWERQLLVAQLWRAVLQSGERVSRAEFLQLAKDLNEATDLGTGYDELVYLIGQWAEL
jgi:hypothetical protein